MASRTITIRTDDITGETEDVEEVAFSLNGTQYHIDLGGGGRERLAAALAPFMQAARSTRRSRGRGSTRDAPAIRAWAAAQGIEVAPRGRIPSSVLAQYDAAH